MIKSKDNNKKAYSSFYYFIKENLELSNSYKDRGKEFNLLLEKIIN